MSDKSDTFVLLGFIGAIFLFVFIAVRIAVVKSIKTIPEPDRSTYLRSLQQQRRTQEQNEAAHATMMEQSQTRIEDFQRMQEGVGFTPEDTQQRQKDAIRDQKQRIKDMQRLNTR